MMEEIGTARLLEPHIILPSQLSPRGARTPEKRLLLAVLEEAIRTFQRYATATDGRSRIIFNDVEAWFASDDTALLYSFIGICDALGVDAAYVRRGLGRWLHRRRTPSRQVNEVPHGANGHAQGVPSRA